MRATSVRHGGAREHDYVATMAATGVNRASPITVRESLQRQILRAEPLMPTGMKSVLFVEGARNVLKHFSGQDHVAGC